jgi:hypothetical protein
VSTSLCLWRWPACPSPRVRVMPPPRYVPQAFRLRGYPNRPDCRYGFQIVIAKFCTPDNTALFDKHLECLEKRVVVVCSPTTTHIARNPAKKRPTNPVGHSAYPTTLLEAISDNRRGRLVQFLLPLLRIGMMTPPAFPRAGCATADLPARTYLGRTRDSGAHGDASGPMATVPANMPTFSSC